MYTLQKSEAGWLEILPGVKVNFRPITRTMVRAAQRAMLAAQEALGPDASQEDRDEAGSEAFDQAMVGRGIVDWSGLGDPKGKAQPVTPEAIALFVEDPLLIAGASAAYVTPFLMKGREKNASSPSPDGISAGATQGKTIATSAATPKKAAVAKSAPIESTRPKATKGTASGKPSRR